MSALIDIQWKKFMLERDDRLAKVERDRWCMEVDALFPSYGFLAHKGYGTQVHLRALNEHGPCDLHRRSFAPVAKLLGK